MTETIAAIASISILITGTAMWFLRMTVTDLKASMTEYSNAIREEFKEFTKEVDRKLDSINLHVDQKIESVKTHIRDVDHKTDRVTDKIHEQEVDFLTFKSELPSEFITRREMEQLTKRLVRLEGDKFDTKD